MTTRKADGTLKTYHDYVLEDIDAAGLWDFPADYGSLISDNRFTFPKDEEPVSYILKIGQRTARFYIVDYPHYLQFSFANLFGLIEELFLPIQMKQTTKTKQSTAVSARSLLTYDRQPAYSTICAQNFAL